MLVITTCHLHKDSGCIAQLLLCLLAWHVQVLDASPLQPGLYVIGAWSMESTQQYGL
jgi:hypothetical protein